MFNEGSRVRLSFVSWYRTFFERVYRWILWGNFDPSFEFLFRARWMKKKGLKDRIVDFSINHCRIFNIYFSDSICIQILEGEKIIIRGDRIMYSVIRSRSKFLFLNCIIRFTVNLNNRVYSIFWNYLVETFHFQYE